MGGGDGHGMVCLRAPLVSGEIGWNRETMVAINGLMADLFPDPRTA